MTKEEKIKEAYGNYYEELKDAMCTNGWVDNRHYDFRNYDIELDFSDYNYKWRARNLKEIENNNGWIKVKDKTDLPQSETWNYDIYYLYEDGTYFYDKSLTLNKVKSLYKQKKLTHWRETDEVPKPLY